MNFFVLFDGLERQFSKNLIQFFWVYLERIGGKFLAPLIKEVFKVQANELFKVLLELLHLFWGVEIVFDGIGIQNQKQKNTFILQSVLDFWNIQKIL